MKNVYKHDNLDGHVCVMAYMYYCHGWIVEFKDQHIRWFEQQCI